MSVGGQLVTRNVEQRLRHEAEKEIPVGRIQQSAELVSAVTWVLLVPGLGVLPWILDRRLGVAGGYLIAAWVVGLVFLIVLTTRLGDRERSRRSTLVGARVEELAQQRQRRIDEAQAFYATAEWKLLRDQVIKEQGRVCCACGATIKSDLEVTVDHIRPRSKYPHLALSKANLRVLCRACNSKKGNRDTE